MKYLYTISAFALALALITSCNAPIQDNGEPEGPHTSIEWQIWAYSTAAPDYIAENATVFDGPGGNLLREGTNGWTCLPANPRGMSDPENGWIDPHDAMPACGDGEFFKWVMAILERNSRISSPDFSTIFLSLSFLRQYRMSVLSRVYCKGLANLRAAESAVNTDIRQRSCVAHVAQPVPAREHLSSCCDGCVTVAGARRTRPAWNQLQGVNCRATICRSANGSVWSRVAGTKKAATGCRGLFRSGFCLESRLAVEDQAASSDRAICEIWISSVPA